MIAAASETLSRKVQEKAIGLVDHFAIGVESFKSGGNAGSDRLIRLILAVTRT